MFSILFSKKYIRMHNPCTTSFCRSSLRIARAETPVSASAGDTSVDPMQYLARAQCAGTKNGGGEAKRGILATGSTAPQSGLGNALFQSCRGLRHVVLFPRCPHGRPLLAAGPVPARYCFREWHLAILIRVFAPHAGGALFGWVSAPQPRFHRLHCLSLSPFCFPLPCP